MTEAELEAIRALGHLGMKPGACSGGEECRFRGAIDDLIGDMERLREGLRAILREHQESRSRPNLCRLCGAHDNWPCVTVLEARAALEGEDET